MNKLLHCLLCTATAGSLLLAASAAAFPVYAEDETDDKNTFTDEMMTYEKISGGVKITAVNPSATIINIPEIIDSYPILGIADDAFAGCASMTELKISAKIKEIGSGAFNGCSALTELKLPDTLTSIGDGAFAKCSGLKELILPERRLRAKAHGGQRVRILLEMPASESEAEKVTRWLKDSPVELQKEG